MHEPKKTRHKNDQANKRADNIRHSIGEMEALSWGEENPDYIGYRSFDAFWKQVSHTQQLFDDNNPITDREELWEDFSTLCKAVKIRIEKIKDSIKLSSPQHKKAIVAELSKANPPKPLPHVARSKQKMKKYATHIDTSIDLINRYKFEMTKEDRENCWRQIESVRSTHHSWWAEFDKGKDKRFKEFLIGTQNNLEKNRRLYKSVEADIKNLKKGLEYSQSKIPSYNNSDMKKAAKQRVAELKQQIINKKKYLTLILNWIEEDETKLEDAMS